MVHVKELELKAVEEGAFVNRHDLMYNDFVIIGPANDPLKIKGMKSALDAFTKIAAQGTEFVSRGDKSGTHVKELAIWKAAEVDPQGRKWYLQTGQGQEKTQRIANERKPIPSPTGAPGWPPRTRTNWKWWWYWKATPPCSTNTG